MCKMPRASIKLDAMENPSPCRPQTKLGERLGRVALNRYPGTRINDLHAALRSHARCLPITVWSWAMGRMN